MKRLAALLIAVVTAFGLLGSSSASTAQAVTFNSWPAVSSGNTNTYHVKTVQYLLTAKGYPTTADGSFGSATTANVKKFQSANGLVADGSVGAATWPKLASYTLREGNTGNAVKALQTQLLRNGYSLSVDGSFGPATLSAVRSFQSKKGLTVDGVVGANTWRGLIAGVASTGGTTTRAQYAQQILNDSGINLLHFCGPTYSSPRQNMVDTAAGRVAYTGGGDVGKVGVYLSTNMLRFMRDFGVNNSYRVTSIAGCDHSSTSLHYKGRAVDIDFANGQKIDTTTAGRNMAARVRNACAAAGARLTLGPGDAGHSGHVHCDWSA
ncbi:peptidoglycan-binding domain-containing protein [Propionibacteriaceae bacterium G1746]